MSSKTHPPYIMSTPTTTPPPPTMYALSDFVTDKGSRKWPRRIKAYVEEQMVLKDGYMNHEGSGRKKTDRKAWFHTLQERVITTFGVEFARALLADKGHVRIKRFGKYSMLMLLIRDFPPLSVASQIVYETRPRNARSPSPHHLRPPSSTPPCRPMSRRSSLMSRTRRSPRRPLRRIYSRLRIAKK